MAPLLLPRPREPDIGVTQARAPLAWRDFHDRFLSYGGPPIPLLRNAMMRDEGSLFRYGHHGRVNARWL